MTAPKRSIEYISDYEEVSEEEYINLSKICRRHEKSDVARESSSKSLYHHSHQGPTLPANTTSQYGSFADFLANNLPTALIPAEAKKVLIYESNARLERAKQEGVNIANISIGDDCLPVWPGFSWDPSVESLHSVIQDRVTAFQNAQDLGNLFRNDLITKSNRRLDEARQQDKSLDAVVIRDGILPEWEDGPSTGRSSQTPIIIDDDSDDESDHETESGSPDAGTASTSVVEAITKSFSMDSDSSRDVDSSESSGISDYASEFDCAPSCFHDSAFLESFIADQLGSCNSGQPHNILHGAHLMSDSRTQSVDLEVFVACEDDDDYHSVYDLPEVEMAIDREAYEYWHGTEEAVDFEFPNMQVRCTGELLSIEDVDDEDEVHIMYTSGKLLFNPTPTIEESDSQTPNDDSLIDASSPSTIVESEYGFRW